MTGGGSSSGTEPLFLGIISPRCIEVMFTNGNVTNPECFRAVLSKTLSMGIIAGALLVKVPQILKVWRNRSAEGLSPSAVYQETACYIITAIFNYLMLSPLETYAEILAITIQNMILCMFMWSFNGASLNHRLSMIVAATIVAGGCFYWPPEFRDPYMFLITMPINASARLSQVWQNWSQGHTGQLAAITLILNFGGTLARIFTSIQEQVAPVILWGSVFGCFMNFLLVFQLMWYWSATSKATAKTSGKRKKSKGDEDKKNK